MPDIGNSFRIQGTQTVIRRRYMHLLFGFISACLLAAIIWQVVKLRQQQVLTQELKQTPTVLESYDGIDKFSKSSTHPFLKLAVGSSLAQGDNLEQAERLLNELSRNADSRQIRTAAQYNLANAYLRKALASGTETSSQSLPLVQLSKQRYRDLLAEEPAHWSARFNLERALRMAPEGTDRTEDGRIEPVKSVDVIVPGFEKKDLP